MRRNIFPTAILTILFAGLICFIFADAQDNTVFVAKVKAEVLAAGIDISHGPGECGRFEITKRVAWQLHAALLAKSGAQNGCSDHNTTDDPKYGVDVIVFEGNVIDILGGSGDDANHPQWIVVGPANSALVRPAFDPGDTTTPPPAPEPVPSTPPVVVPDLKAELDEINAKIDALKTQSDANTEKVQQQIDQVVKNAEGTLKNPSFIAQLVHIVTLGLAGGK